MFNIFQSLNTCGCPPGVGGTYVCVVAGPYPGCGCGPGGGAGPCGGPEGG